MADREKESLILSDNRLSSIERCLSSLHLSTAAKCILLSDIAGQLIARVGLTGELDVVNLVSLLAGGFGVTFEMANYLGEKEAFNLNYHEGSTYDVYSANVGRKLFITLIFDHQARESKIGLVWLYMKRAIPELLEIMTTSGQTTTLQAIDAEFGASLSEKLDNLFT
jgi:hypothetical protein